MVLQRPTIPPKFIPQNNLWPKLNILKESCGGIKNSSDSCEDCPIDIWLWHWRKIAPKLGCHQKRSVWNNFHFIQSHENATIRHWRQHGSHSDSFAGETVKGWCFNGKESLTMPHCSLSQPFWKCQVQTQLAPKPPQFDWWSAVRLVWKCPTIFNFSTSDAMEPTLKWLKIDWIQRRIDSQKWWWDVKCFSIAQWAMTWNQNRSGFQMDWFKWKGNLPPHPITVNLAMNDLKLTKNNRALLVKEPCSFFRQFGKEAPTKITKSPKFGLTMNSSMLRRMGKHKQVDWGNRLSKLSLDQQSRDFELWQNNNTMQSLFTEQD